tara:strand:+ start:152 stop:355 length:204 start_codon:yes stop_codon:yes gene_type:complete
MTFSKSFNYTLATTQKKMKTNFFKLIAKANKAILPSYSKKQLDLSKASKLQLGIIGWRVYVTKNALG